VPIEDQAIEDHASPPPILWQAQTGVDYSDILYQ
jgi:hypothetical protein